MTATYSHRSTVPKGHFIITANTPNTDNADTGRTLFSHPPTQTPYDHQNQPTGQPISYENLFREPTRDPAGHQHRAA